MPRTLVLVFDRCLTPADTGEERAICRMTGAPLPWAGLPVNAAVLSLARAARAEGQRVIVLTADAAPAKALLAEAGLAAEVVLTQSTQGDEALTALRHVIRAEPFAFVGPARAGKALWQAAHSGWLVGCDPKAIAGPECRILPLADGRRASGPKALWQAMRPHHWVKNLLILVPLVSAHRWTDANAILSSLLALITFCLASSAVYLLNDLFDLADDRRHQHKDLRPVAAGQLGAFLALQAAGLLLFGALLMAALLASDLWLLSVTLVYAALALAYSRWIKTLRFVDLVCLGALYTLRILAGAAATGIPASAWLLALSLCLFSSLSAAKRSAELMSALHKGMAGIERRGYRHLDRPAVNAFGAVFALCAGLVLAFYAASQDAARLYGSPWVLHLANVCLMSWVLWIWRQVADQKLQGDPIHFALRDRTSWLLAAALALCVGLAIP